MSSFISQDQSQVVWYRNQLRSWKGEKNSIYFYYEKMYKMFLDRLIKNHNRVDLAVKIGRGE